MLRKQSDLHRGPDAAWELSFPGQNKLPKYIAPKSVAEPAREAAMTQKPRAAGEDSQLGSRSPGHWPPGT